MADNLKPRHAKQAIRKNKKHEIFQNSTCTRRVNGHLKALFVTYKRRACPHGLTGKRLNDGQRCPNRHPPLCFRYSKHGDTKKLGCTKGNECKHFHPRLCRNSVTKRVCLNEDRTFHHLKHTQRPQ